MRFIACVSAASKSFVIVAAAPERTLNARSSNATTITHFIIRSLSFLTNYPETVAKAQAFLDDNTNSSDIPEVRFLLAIFMLRKHP